MMLSAVVLLMVVGGFAAESGSLADSTFRSEADCQAINVPALKSRCEGAVGDGKAFTFDKATLSAYESRGFTVFNGLKIASGKMDTTRTISIHGDDTTITLSISPHVDYSSTQKDIHSIAASAKFMAVVSGIGLAASVITFLVVLGN